MVHFSGGGDLGWRKMHWGWWEQLVEPVQGGVVALEAEEFAGVAMEQAVLQAHSEGGVGQDISVIDEVVQGLWEEEEVVAEEHEVVVGWGQYTKFAVETP